jgi:ADP-ribose pyrophosphatase YjhB (NUDIX family)
MAWFLIEQEGAVLVVRRKDDALAFAGQWTLPGDFLRDGESSQQAALRFARDELGVLILGQEFRETLLVTGLDESYKIDLYRVGFEGQLRYGSAGPFAEVAWATIASAPEPMPTWLRALLQRLFRPGVNHP